jgi:signal transduction histidine kinase
MASEPPSDSLGTPPLYVPSLPPDPTRYEKQLDAIMDIAWSLSSTLNFDALLPAVMERVTALIAAERSTFFIVDHAKRELWSKVLQGGVPSVIRLSFGEGIAGSVAESGESVNLLDAYDDPRFNRTYDIKSGYRTRSLLSIPILDRSHRVTAVIQCLNKQGRRRFDAEDEELLRCISGQLAVALESAHLYEALLSRKQQLELADARLRRANAELEILYELERLISETDDVEQLLRSVVERACALLKVDAAAIVLASETGAQALLHVDGTATRVETVDLRLARQAIARAQLPSHRVGPDAVATVDLVLPGLDAKSVRETFSAPLSDARSTIGALQLVNRRDDGAPPDWVLRIVSLLAAQVARGVVVKREREASERAGRLAMLGTSVGAIVHDLRTPMTAIGGFAELMVDEDDAAVRKSYSERVSRALGHMETMTSEVLAFTRGKREVLIQKVYVDKFVEATREMLLPETAAHGAKLVVEAAGDVGVARFDESKLKRVIFNLARNACQAMGPGGTFTWRVRRATGFLIFECGDSGPGIPKEMEGRLFESFATHGKQDGTGLGLAMAKKIVDAHCGTIELVSEPGHGAHGALFRITLPV